MAKEVEQNISNRAHGFPPVTKRGSFVRSKTSSFSLLRIVPFLTDRCQEGSFSFSFSKETNLLRQRGVLGGFNTCDGCMAMHGEESMMEDFILDDGRRRRKNGGFCLMLVVCFSCGSLMGAMRCS
jgi:hypothetical protein